MITVRVVFANIDTYASVGFVANVVTAMLVDKNKSVSLIWKLNLF